jgi:peptidoglycan/xylan/chitin deacetylase (PgdA/CDA1 family)
MRLASISIDLDEIHHYYAIHGLAGRGRTTDLVYDRAVPRASDWAQALGVPLTFFVVGSDLGRAENAETLRTVAGSGHELANHTLSHHYDLTRRDPREMEREVAGGIDALVRATGQRPLGFRAPGYLVNDQLVGVLGALGVGYDSSVFPSPAYYAAKAAKLITLKLRGRTSRSVQGSAKALLAPSRPYRLGTPYWKAGRGLPELPIQVTPGTRLPYIGTSLVLAGADGARLMTRTLLLEPFVNLELHGLDFLGADDDLDELKPHQPDARLGRTHKLAALTAAVELLRKMGFSFIRLDEAARAIA